MKIGILDGVITRGSPIEFLLSTAATATELAVEAEFVVVVVVLPLLVLLYSFEMIILPSMFIYQTTRNVFSVSLRSFYILYFSINFNCCNYKTLRKEIIIIMTMFVYSIYHILLVLVLLLRWWNYYWLIDCRSFFYYLMDFGVHRFSNIIIVIAVSFSICRHPIIVILTTIISNILYNN